MSAGARPPEPILALPAPTPAPVPAKDKMPVQKPHAAARLPNEIASPAPAAQADAVDAAAKTTPGALKRQGTKAKEPDQPTVFGSFWIDSTEFALPVTVIQEMVGEPDKFAPVPLSPPHVVGVFNLRDTIIPVVDLRILLGFPECPEPGARKIAVIENGAHCLGLLFDDAGGVLHSEGATRVDFDVNYDGEKDVVVEGLLKFDGGKRMVQILDPYELLSIPRLPRVAKKKAGQKSHLGQRTNCISFQLGHTRCALDLRYVQEIMDVPDVQKSPLSHGHILGNIELRGHTLPIVDFRGMLGNEPPHQFSQEALRSRKLVILNLDAGLIGLLVYSIDSIMTYFESDVMEFASLTLPRNDIVAGCLINDAHEIVILLDHHKLLRDPALANAARSCREVYPPAEQQTEREDTHATSGRTTFILFTVAMPLAFDISCVSEIINLPDKLLQPPYAFDFVDGILNLRGELITLINPRKLYKLPAAEQTGTKVLIFQVDSKKYGMVVDSVDEIVSINTKALLDVPAIVKKGVKRVVCEDVEGCVSVPSRGVEAEPVLVMNVGALISRCVEVEG